MRLRSCLHCNLSGRGAAAAPVDRSATATRTVAVVPHASRTFADTLQLQRRSHGTLGQRLMEWCFAAVKRQFRVIGPSLYTFVIERRRASHPPDERAHPCSREVPVSYTHLRAH